MATRRRVLVIVASILLVPVVLIAALLVVAQTEWAERSLEDPFGHVWHLATHVEDLTPAEMKRRGEAEAKKQGGGAS